MSACPTCGANAPPDARFCPACGAYLGWATTADAVPPTAPPEPAPPEPAPPEPAPPEPAPPEHAPPEHAPPGAAPPAPTPAPAGSLDAAMAALTRTQALAEQLGRPDLGARLARTRDELEQRPVVVAVVGEFKRGKSTLVNALVRAEVCPVDADIVTAVPTLLRHGDTASAVALLEDAAAPGGVSERPVPVEALAGVVMEPVDQRTGLRVRSLEVRLDRRELRTGLCLVDTPGVGGLESAHGAVTLAALTSARALVFVTDASQELTAPELAFLRQALERCERAVCVVTKIDLHAHWRRIVELDREHLARAGLDVPVLAVSSFLRIRALGEQQEEKHRLNAESGFKELYAWLAAEVLDEAHRAAAEVAAEGVGFAQEQLRTEVEGEHLVLTNPEEAPAILERLEQDTRRTSALAAAGATWQQALTFGIEDLVADVQHDLAERIKLLLRDTEEAVDRTDPKETWEALGAWLQKQVVECVAANHDLMRERAAALSDEVARTFALEAGAPAGVVVHPRRGQATGPQLGALDDSAMRSGRTARLVFVGRSVTFLPVMTFGLAGHLLLMSVVGPLAVAVGVGIGRKMIRDERTRQVTYRRQVAKATVRRHLDDVLFEVGKDCRDALSVTRRELLLDFQARADLMRASAERAAAAARRAAEVPPQERAERAAQARGRAAVIARVGAGLGRVP